MEKNKTIAFVAVLVLVVAAIGVGIFVLNNDESAGDRTVTDSRGREITVPNDIETIFCSNCCSLELISWFDSVDKVCGIDSNDTITGNKTYTQVFKDEFSKLKVITVSNAEEVIALGPTVFISSTVSVEDLNNEQNTYGIPVYGINADLEMGSEDWFTQIIKLGKLLKEEDRAKELVDGVKSLIGDITSKKVTNVNGYACGMMFYGAGNFIKTTGDYLPFDYSGVKNVMPTNKAGTKQPYNTDIESILATDFDYIFIDGSSVPTTVDQIKTAINETTLGNKDAIKNGDIYKVLVYKVWGTQWDNQLINCFYVADTVNGDSYSWSFEDKANEVLELFYGDNAPSYSSIAAGESNGGCGKVIL